jgi:hypothetical protein
MFGFDLDEKDACKVPLSQELSNQYIRKISDKQTKSEARCCHTHPLMMMRRIKGMYGEKQQHPSLKNKRGFQK